VTSNLITEKAISPLQMQTHTLQKPKFMRIRKKLPIPSSFLIYSEVAQVPLLPPTPSAKLLDYPHISRWVRGFLVLKSRRGSYNGDSPQRCHVFSTEAEIPPLTVACSPTCLCRTISCLTISFLDLFVCESGAYICPYPSIMP